MFRGREQSRPELGYNLLQRLASDVEEFGFIESSPKQDGRNMLMVLGPHKNRSALKAERGGGEPKENGQPVDLDDEERAKPVTRKKDMLAGLDPDQI
jgi:translation initiation factor IF-3